MAGPRREPGDRGPRQGLSIAAMPGPHRFLPLLLLAPLALVGCRSSYSPDDYATRAVQQMNRVEQGTVIGARRVTVTAEGSTGAATGAAAGGILGSQSPGGNMAGAIGAVGGALVGGLLGTATERIAGDTTAVEYIVRKENGEMFSVTQRDQTPLPIGQRVLLIGGAQARIVPDYTAPVAAAPTPAGPQAQPAPAAPAAAPVAEPLPALAPSNATLQVAPPPLPAPPVLVPPPPPVSGG